MAEARGPRAAHLMDTGAASSDGSSPAVQPATPPRSLNVTITPRSIWLAMALVVALLVVIVLVTKAQSALVVVFVALILAEGIRPPVRWLNQKAHVPRPLGVLLIYLAALLVFALLVALLLQPVVVQVSTLSSHVPDYLKQLQTLINGILQAFNANAMFGQLATQVASALQSVVPALLGVPSGVLGILFGVVVILTMTIFWLSTTDGFSPFVLDLFPSEKREEVASIFGELSRALAGYGRGTLVNMVAIGVFTGLGLFILGVPYALLLGILAGLTELIPYLGPWISGPVAFVVALITGDPLKAVEVALFFVLIQQLEGNTLQPLVMSRAVHVNPFVVLVAITIGVQLLGVVGAVLAVPAVAALQVLVLRVLAPAPRRAAPRPAPAAGPTKARAIVTPDTPTSSDVPGAPGAPGAQR